MSQRSGQDSTAIGGNDVAWRGGGGAIDARYSQGFVNQPSGPVTQNYYGYALPPMPPISREQLLEAVHLASAELRHYSAEIAGMHLERAEVAEIIEWVRNADPKERLGMLLDQPGGGKTVVMRDVLLKLEAAGMPVLAIKADTLSGIESRAELADELGLPAPVEECVRGLASEGLFFVILDQLDALSLTLSRNQATLDVMLRTLSRLRTMSNVRLVASCRSFDLNNDPHLSTIQVDRKFELRPLHSEQVNRVLHTIGINPTTLLPAHRTLLTVPLHLEIYACVVTTETPRQMPESYRSLQELYEALWQKRIAAILPDTPSPTERIQAINKLVQVMKNRRQPKLTAPLATLDKYPEAANYLQRVQIIRREKSNCLFFHQTFFDYCYARHVVAEGASLSQKIWHSSQGLFYRSLMVQVLAYLRGSDEVAYRRELSELLFTDGLRTHLRLLLIAWFGSLLAPNAEEKRIADRLMRNTDDLTLFLQAIAGNVGWFDLLKERKLRSLLRSKDEKNIEQTIKYLHSLIKHRPDAVLTLLQPYLGKSEAWDKQITYCLSALDNWQNDNALNMFCDLLRRVQTTNWGNLAFHKLANSNPAGGCRALRVYLDHRLAIYRGSENDDFALDRSLLDEYEIKEVLKAAVKECPEKMIEHLLPWLVSATITLVKPRRKNSYPSDSVFDLAWYGSHLRAGAAFAKYMTEALKYLALTAPSAFRSIAATLMAIESLTIHRLLAYAYLADPGNYANDIFDYLIADARRLNIGEPIENPHYESCLLYGAVFLHVDIKRQAALERLILDLRPIWEQRNPPHSGITQLRFFKRVPRERLSKTAQRKRQELERKFPDFEGTAPPRGVIAVWVGPPIPETAQAKMSDEAWLGAMRKYDDSTEWDAPSRDQEKGGAVELSRALGRQVKKEPERFYHLAKRFDDTISLYYIEATISNLVESDAPTEWAFDLTRQFMSRIKQDFRRGICQALEKRAKDGVPDDLLDMMTDWALNDPDPREEMWRLPSGNGKPYYEGKPHWPGINSNRGVAIQTVCRSALQHQSAQIERVFQLLEQAANDPSTAVRACVIESLRPLLNEDETRTLTIFEQALDGHPRLLQSPLAHHFLRWVHHRHFPRIRPFIDALLTNEDEQTRQVGGSLSCLAAFEHPEASELVEQVMQGDAAMRRGAAQVYAHNLGRPEIQAICEQQLRQLMHDPDEQVRINVSECFEHLHPEDVTELRPFIEEFLDSLSLLARPYHLIRYLTPLATSEHDLVLNGIEHLLERIGTELVNIPTSLARLEKDLVRLPLAVYNYAIDPATKSRAMALFERLLLLDSRVAQEALADWDRR